MHKVLIPTKLDKFAADMLTQKGYEVILDAASPIEEQVAKNSDAEVLIVRSEKVTREYLTGQKDPGRRYTCRSWWRPSGSACRCRCRSGWRAR